MAKTCKHLMLNRIVNENVCTNKKDVKNMDIHLYLPANGGFNPPFVGKYRYFFLDIPIAFK